MKLIKETKKDTITINKLREFFNNYDSKNKHISFLELYILIYDDIGIYVLEQDIYFKYIFKTLSGVRLWEGHNLYCVTNKYWDTYVSALKNAIEKGYIVEIFNYEEEYMKALYDEIHSMYNDLWN